MALTRAIGVSKVTVGRWQECYLAKGIAGLRRDATRPGGKPPLFAETICTSSHWSRFDFGHQDIALANAAVETLTT